ncbi:hypothetical protein [Streptomyces sp. NPDC058401]|uniref:hypothetical protein n=1 Tax=Streptomyces sp. NPDC058401 TaxID=3346480 RepID=UPI0036689420
MRTALRTSIVTAALAGALLAPAATAIAAPSQAATSVSAVSAVAAASADPSGDERYGGEIVDLGEGKIGVLRNKSEGPEVWIRAGAPGHGWAGRVLAMLDTTHKRAVIEGVQYDLKKIEDGPDKGRYVFNVYVLGEGALRAWYLLPKAEPVAKPSTKPAVKPSAKPPVKPAVKPATVPAAKPAATPAAKPQTAVVPKGPVAAGAELAETAPTAASDTDRTTTAATGAALIAILAGLGTAFAVRTRRARARA